MNKVKLFNNKQKNNHYSMDKIYPRNVSFYRIVEWQKADPATHVFQPFLLQLQKLILFSFSNHVAGNRFFLKSYLINDLFRYNYGHKNIKFISLPQLFNGYKKWWTRDSFCTHIWNVEIILTHRAARDEVQQILPMSGLIQSLNRNRWWTERRHYSEATLGRALSF